MLHDVNFLCHTCITLTICKHMQVPFYTTTGQVTQWIVLEVALPFHCLPLLDSKTPCMHTS